MACERLNRAACPLTISAEVTRDIFQGVLMLVFLFLVQRSDVAEARKLWERYVVLERSFDVAIAELYADGALIENTRRYPNGQTRTIRIPVDEYRRLIRAAMPLAKARGDLNRYSAVKVTPEGKNVRITAVRYSELKKYESPISLLVGRDRIGRMAILEERGESRP